MALPELTYIDYLFLPIILFIGIYTSQEDINESKIRNKWILYGLKGGILAFIALILLVYLQPGPMGFDYWYLAKVGLNTAIALGLGCAMWYFDLWAAGDAKLFTVFIFLLPLKYYNNGYFPYFPGLALLLNVFTAVLLFLILTSLRSILAKFNIFLGRLHKQELSLSKLLIQGKKYFKDNYKTLLREFIVSLTAFFVVRILFGYLQQWLPTSLPLVQLGILAVLLASYRVIEAWLDKKWWLVYLTGIVVIGYYGTAFFYWQNLSWPELRWQLSFPVLFIVLYRYGGSLLEWYNEKTEIKYIPATDLKPFMLLHSEEIEALRVKSKYFRKEKFYADGIREDQIKPILELCEECGVSELRIYKTFAFAPWIFMGVLITVWLQASVVHVVLAFFR